MPPRPRLSRSFATAAVVLATACGAATVDVPPPELPAASVGATAPMASVASLAAPADAAVEPEPETPPEIDLGAAAASQPASACSAPSLNLAEQDDVWNTPSQQVATYRCQLAGRGADLARLLEGALPLDVGTAAHVARIFEAGSALGRRANVFGLVGDSMTLSGHFLRPFAASNRSARVPAEVEDAFALDAPSGDARTVLDLFRGPSITDAPSGAGRSDSFIAPRAAKVGARVTWALAPRGPNEANPIDDLVRTLSPAYAVILYGANDAVWGVEPPDVLAGRFEDALSRVVAMLEARGVVPVLTTVPRHMHEWGWPDRAPTPEGVSNERFAVQATALSAAVAHLACARRLPLIDLRWSLEPLLNHGVGPDGVHLSVHPAGGGVLDPSGLECGYNVRNLVTLRELALIVGAASSEVGASDVW
ncbi:MAG TPA: SGNH/GDSL hydrolase family protein [Polyangiaceae bacterium]|nr:SGNH/GDSL hydrolase family protein [Polyangiaceae bacterium]